MGYIPKKDSSGRAIVRYAATIEGWHYQYVEVEICTSSIDNGAKSFNLDGTDNTEFTIKCYDSSDVELTTEATANANAVKTVIIWAPQFDYEVLGGKLHIKDQATNDVRMHAMAGPVDLGAAYCKPFIPSMNLKYLVPGAEINTDGRASKLLNRVVEGVPVDANKFQITISHPQAEVYNFAMGFEIFRA